MGECWTWDEAIEKVVSVPELSDEDPEKWLRNHAFQRGGRVSKAGLRKQIGWALDVIEIEQNVSNDDGDDPAMSL